MCSGVSHILSAEQAEGGRRAKRVERTRVEEFESYLTEGTEKKTQGTSAGVQGNRWAANREFGQQSAGNADLKILPRLPEIAPTTLDNSISCRKLCCAFLLKVLRSAKDMKISNSGGGLQQQQQQQQL